MEDQRRGKRWFHCSSCHWSSVLRLAFCSDCFGIGGGMLPSVPAFARLCHGLAMARPPRCSRLSRRRPLVPFPIFATRRACRSLGVAAGLGAPACLWGVACHLPPDWAVSGSGGAHHRLLFRYDVPQSALKAPKVPRGAGAGAADAAAKEAAAEDRAAAIERAHAEAPTIGWRARRASGPLSAFWPVSPRVTWGVAAVLSWCRL